MKKITRRTTKILGFTLAGLVILCLGALLFLKLAGPEYIKNQLSERVTKRTNGRYSLVIDTLDYQFFPISLHLGGVSFNRVEEIGDYSGSELLDKFDINLQFRSLYIDEFKVLKLIFGNQLDVNNFNWVEPSLIVYKNRNYDGISETMVHSQDSASSGKLVETDTVLADADTKNEFVNASRDALPVLHFDQLLIQKAYLSLYDGITENPVHEVKGLNLSLSDVRFKEDDDMPFGVEGLSVQIDTALTVVSEGIAEIGVTGLHINPEKYHIDSVYFHHTVNRYQINRIKGFRANWVDLRAKNLDVSGLDYAQMIEDSAVLVNKIRIEKLNVNLFKDKSDKRIDPTRKPLPPELIRNIPVPLKVDTLQIQNATLMLDLQAPSAKIPGSLLLDPIQLQITNMTNLEDRLENDPMMKIGLDTKLMGITPLKVHYQFRVNDPADSFTVRGSLDPMNARVLNPFIRSQFFVEFRSGYFQTLDFSFNGNNKANVGEMDLEYRKLSFRKVRDYQKFVDKNPHMGFITTAGSLVIPSNRSKSKKNYQKSVIYYEKEENRDFIHGTVMSVLSGFTNSLGILRKDLDKKKDQARQL